MADMYINRMPLHCRTCRHDWTHEHKLPISIAKYIEAMQQLRCPHCHAGMLALNIEFGMVTLRARASGEQSE